MRIIGAGMAGCLAAALNPKAIVYEAAAALPDNHRAVLRFRGDAISKATGIPFRKVQVRKAIWHDGVEHQPSPRLCNWYSKKVAGLYMNRSIMNIAPSERYIAPDDFHQKLAELCGDRIKFGERISDVDLFHTWRLLQKLPVISTIPMPVLCNILGIEHDEEFKFQSITVTRFKVSGADIFQTIYYPYPDTGIYRATMTGDDLIVESIGKRTILGVSSVYNNVCESFGLDRGALKIVDEAHQQYGKIAPINEIARKNIMLRMTTEFGVYSLGRYACWRNILLDDVYEDIFKIRRMMAHHHYDLHLEARK